MKRTLCAVGLGAVCLTWTASASAQSGDHLKCYKVKDPQAKTTYTADLGGLVAEPGCIIKVPAIMGCVPATKTNITPTPPGGGGTGTPNSFFCYKTKCPKATPPPLAGTDQFGSRTVTPTAAKLVCAPLAGPPTTTATSTTTTTVPGSACALPATGQTTCWDPSGTPTPVPCAGTGQDGDLQKGAPLAYMDNGDGTITDNNTGLVWEKLSADGSVHDQSNTYTWANAFAQHVATLNTMSFAGHTDWRVPNVRELQSIANYENSNPAVSPAFNTGCAGGCTVLTCSCTPAFPVFWSSTTFAQGANQAWTVTFNGGFVEVNNKLGGIFVRAVRGGS